MILRKNLDENKVNLVDFSSSAPTCGLYDHGEELSLAVDGQRHRQKQSFYPHQLD